jgi:hypothetical protein
MCIRLGSRESYIFIHLFHVSSNGKVLTTLYQLGEPSPITRFRSPSAFPPGSKFALRSSRFYLQLLSLQPSISPFLNRNSRTAKVLLVHSIKVIQGPWFLVIFMKAADFVDFQPYLDRLMLGWDPVSIRKVPSVMFILPITTFSN